MHPEQDIQEMTQQDIAACEDVLGRFSFDKDRMEPLFHLLLFRYMPLITGFSDRIQVVSAYEPAVRMAEVYRANLKLMLLRLRRFFEHGCIDQPPALPQAEDTTYPSFSEVRMELGITASVRGQAGLMQCLDEMEALYAEDISAAEKWERLRPHVLWLSGKEVTVARGMLPLFMKLIDKKECEDAPW